MANYNYKCSACEKKARETYADELVEDGSGAKYLPSVVYEEFVLFETSHMMHPTSEELYEAIECPRCGGHDCTKTMHGAEIHSYIKGYGWLDRDGIKRDMNRYKLATDDPYAKYRTPGEVDHIDSQLKKGGQYDPKRKHFLTGSKDIERAVAKITSPSPSPSPNDV